MRVFTNFIIGAICTALWKTVQFRQLAFDDVMFSVSLSKQGLEEQRKRSKSEKAWICLLSCPKLTCSRAPSYILYARTHNSSIYSGTPL